MSSFLKKKKKTNELEEIIDSKNTKKIKTKNWEMKSIFKTINELKTGKIKGEKKLYGKLFKTYSFDLFYYNIRKGHFYNFTFGASSLKVITDSKNNITRIEDKSDILSKESSDIVELFIREFKLMLDIIDFKGEGKTNIKNILEKFNSDETYKKEIIQLGFSTNTKLTGEEGVLIKKVEEIIPYIEERKDVLDFEDIHEFEKIVYTKFFELIRTYKDFNDEQKERNRPILINVLKNIFNQLNEFKTKIEKRGESKFLKIASMLNDKGQIL